ncbi:hypothetical protein FB566_5141 [Stackebrandtia endophytica]|uniref:Antitoxin protein of toxin-antitoxin system n=1 Tax=Stackebrandtia endophytica TaxID=1496996 RepID=A0A543B3Z5_9ACTN|nr:Rv0909 family putative TA system antitoxin [Stackebrandtia endophytica]TQL79532.1 hypothetical protein FB566_5141 [Stackebrandtia endophytica]
MAVLSHSDYDGGITAMGITDKLDDFKDKARGKAEELKGEIKGKSAEVQGRAKGKKSEAKGKASKAKNQAKRSSSGSPVDKAAGFVNDKTNNKYRDQVNRAADKVKDATGQGR